MDGTLALLTAALAGKGALEALLDVSVADDWEGFPEVLPVLCESYRTNPECHRWGSAPAFQGQSLATDGVMQMVKRAFEHASVRAVDAHTLGHENPSTLGHGACVTWLGIRMCESENS